MIFRKKRTFWMKKKTLIALILLACMLLTACGSTGGSTDSSSDTVVESSTPEPVEAKADAKAFDEMTAEGDTLLELKELAEQQQPVRILTGSGMCDYTAELVNVTELDLSGSYISIYPMDENGEPYDTYGGAAGSWKPGESLDIYFMGTRELMPTTVGLSIELPNALKTDYMPLSFKEAGADFILKDAPCEAGDRVKFRFDSVSADSPLWLDGEASLFIWLEGEKTYDAFFAMLQDYVDHPENYTQEEAEKYTADTMPENLSWFLSFGTYCRGIGLDPDCAADILANPEDYYDSLSIFFPAANFTVEVYSSSGELVAEKPVFYENYAVGEKLRGTDTEQIHLYGLAPDTYTVVIKES